MSENDIATIEKMLGRSIKECKVKHVAWLPMEMVYIKKKNTLFVNLGNLKKI